MSDISELLEYLKNTGSGTISHTKLKDWASAVEQLAQDERNFRKLYFQSNTKVEAYERILNKGLTVNVYQDGNVQELKEDLLQMNWYCKSCKYANLKENKACSYCGNPRFNRGESEEKVDPVYAAGDSIPLTQEEIEAGINRCKVEQPGIPKNCICGRDSVLVEEDCPFHRPNRGKSDNSEAGE